jgi:molecular chaperone Hsp33
MDVKSSSPFRLGAAPQRIDRVLPFQIETVDARGRIAQLNGLLDEILSAHSYPAPVATVLAEALLLGSLLGSMLKDAGQLTLQIRSDGPISLLVVDCTAAGDLRGYAQFDAQKVATCPLESRLPDLFGKGYLAITIEQGDPSERYQGIVDLEGDNLAECAQAYFQSSDQLPTCVRLGVRHDPLEARWIAGGLLLQYLARGEEGADRLFATDDTARENWVRARTLSETVRFEELTDPSLPLEDLLWRLFHEEGVRVFTDERLQRGCRCSLEKIKGVLRQFSFDDLMDMREPDGSIKVNCAFCSRDWIVERPKEREA